MPGGLFNLYEDESLGSLDTRKTGVGDLIGPAADVAIVEERTFGLVKDLERRVMENNKAIRRDFTPKFPRQPGDVQALPNPFSIQGIPSQKEYLRRREEYDSRVREFLKLNPDRMGDVKFSENILQEAVRDAGYNRERFDYLAEKASGGDWLAAQFLGAIPAVASDPVNILSLGLGATNVARQGIMRTVAQEAAANAFAEGAVLPALSKTREDLTGEGLSTEEAALRVGAGGALGGLFGLGIGTLARANTLPSRVASKIKKASKDIEAMTTKAVKPLEELAKDERLPQPLRDQAKVVRDAIEVKNKTPYKAADEFHTEHMATAGRAYENLQEGRVATHSEGGVVDLKLRVNDAFEKVAGSAIGKEEKGFLSEVISAIAEHPELGDQPARDFLEGIGLNVKRGRDDSFNVFVGRGTQKFREGTTLRKFIQEGNVTSFDLASRIKNADSVFRLREDVDQLIAMNRSEGRDDVRAVSELLDFQERVSASQRAAQEEALFSAYDDQAKRFLTRLDDVGSLDEHEALMAEAIPELEGNPAFDDLLDVATKVENVLFAAKEMGFDKAEVRAADEAMAFYESLDSPEARRLQESQWESFVEGADEGTVIQLEDGNTLTLKELMEEFESDQGIIDALKICGLGG